MIRSSLQLLFLLLIVTELLCASAHMEVVPTEGMPEAPRPTREQVNKAIALSADYLERNCGPDGKFVYEVNINNGRQNPWYGIIRHSGAMYSLAMLNRIQPDPKAVDTMVAGQVFCARTTSVPERIPTS